MTCLVQVLGSPPASHWSGLGLGDDGSERSCFLKSMRFAMAFLSFFFEFSRVWFAFPALVRFNFGVYRSFLSGFLRVFE